MDIDQSNTALKKIIDFINNTDCSIFLNGKAGTGKTTFLKFLKEHTYKNSIIVAPTGVAAINANGITIHSFFRLPIIFISPDNYGILTDIKLDAAKRKTLNELELLIIDEISMVRADTLDAIDIVMRKARGKDDVPFGGLQVLYIGDIYQLSPIVNANESDELKKWYKSPYFFDSNVFQKSHPISIELEKVYRQSDIQFIDLLNSVRDNTITEDQLNLLNQQVQSTIDLKNEGYIFLTTHNRKVDSLNKSMLHELQGQEYCFTAVISGKFEEMLYPAEYELRLKVGAQLMLLKNDKGKARKYFNGKIGILEKIENEKIFVRFDNEEILELEKEVWRNIDYKYDEEYSALREYDLGTFQQFPIRLAWAITVHKSQGLSFEKAVVDVNEAFLPGQVYVALSRLRSFKGLVLHSKINREVIKVDLHVHNFWLANHSQQISDDFLPKQEAIFIRKTILRYFDWEPITESIKASSAESIDFLVPYFEIIKLHRNIAERFSDEIAKIFNGAENQNAQYLDTRITTAVRYFALEISSKLLTPIKLLLKNFRNNLNYKKYIAFLQTIISALEKKLNELKELELISRELVSSKNIGGILLDLKNKRSLAIPSKTKKSNSKKNSTILENPEITSLSLFSAGKTIQEIASTKNLSISAVEYQLASFINSGEINILDIVNKSQIEVIMAILDEHENLSITTIKQKAGENFSLGQIHAIMQYKKSLTN